MIVALFVFVLADSLYVVYPENLAALIFKDFAITIAATTFTMVDGVFSIVFYQFVKGTGSTDVKLTKYYLFVARWSLLICVINITNALLVVLEIITTGVFQTVMLYAYVTSFCSTYFVFDYMRYRMAQFREGALADRAEAVNADKNSVVAQAQ